MSFPTTSMDIATSISLGILSEGRARAVHGYVATAAVTRVAIRATTYTAPGTDAQRSIRSANAADTAAGTGARTVRITYFDAAMNGPFTEDVTLAGTTWVNTVATNIAFVQCIMVLTVGSGGNNVGIITLNTGTGGGGSAIGSIAATENRTNWAHHYVPVNTTALFTDVKASSTNVACLISTAVTNPTNINVAEQNLMGHIRISTTTTVAWYSVPIVVQGPALITLMATPAANTASTMHAQFGVYEI